ncbi:MAG: hypothetical protein PHX78_06555 [bacterium]|nr:hypothetical protein [bacterium]
MLDFIWNIPTVIDIVSKIRNYFNWEIEKAEKKRKGYFHEFDFINPIDSANIWKGILGKDFYLSDNYWKGWKIADNIKKIYPGDVVCVNNAILSRWIPVLPGQIFSKAIKSLDKESKRLDRYVEDEDGEVEAKMLFDTEYKFKSGVASIRVLSRNNRHLLCCSTPFTFTGLPILIDDKTYKSKILEAERYQNCLQADLECILTEIPSEWNKDLIRLVPEQFLKQYTLPRYYLELKNISKQIEAPQCIAAAWSGFVNSSMGETFKSSHFIINNGDESIKDASEKVISYINLLRSSLIGGNWKTIFNFDELKRWIPEKTFNPLDHDINGVTKAIKEYYKNF